MMKFSMLIILVSFALSFFFVALIIKISNKHTWFDTKDERKIHNGNVPRLGGLGFSAAFIIVAVIITLVDKEFSPGLRFLFPILGLIIITCLGGIDDFHPLSPRIKLLIQCACALLVILPGYTFTRPFFFESGILAELGWLKYPLSFFWIVGMVNAVNFIDGVDALGGGVSALIALGYAAVFVLMGNGHPGMLICFCLAAVLLGFLIFNAPLPHARIFMGDGGSYFLGFTLALLPFITHPDSSNTPPLFYIVALVLIPVYDTVAAIWRRLRDHQNISSPDRSHVHHKLINLGLSFKQVILVLYGLQIFLIAMVIFSIKTSGALSIVLLLAAYAGCLIFYATVHFLNRRILKP